MSSPHTLIDWLYTGDIGPEKQGALVLFPRMVDRWNVASTIVAGWEKHKVFIITDHPNEFMSTLDVPHKVWTDEELIPFPLIKYSNLSDINAALRNTEIDIILFDDTRMLSIISTALDFTNLAAKVIVLSSWGDTRSQLDTVTLKLPGLRLLKLSLINDTSTLVWSVAQAQMSARQTNLYNMVRQRELSTPNKILYPQTRRVTLYAYPNEIVSETLIIKPICEVEDESSNENWLQPRFLDTLEEDGAKLASVLDSITATWPAKQVVFTRFNHRYGVDLIFGFIQLMIKEGKIQYNMDEVFHVSCTDEHETTLNAFHKFNDADSALLITNIVPHIPLKGVSVIQVCDSYSFMTLKMLIDRCHKRYLGKTSSNLMIYSHIATHSSEVSADVALHNTLRAEVVGANKLYDSLIAQAGWIAFDSNAGLVVHEPGIR